MNVDVELLAILGRGIRQTSEGGLWGPTNDLEMHDDGFKPRVERLPADDTHQNCFVSGSQLNIEAGAVLCKRHSPKAVVCGYGGQSPYLTAIPNSPSDSEVLSEALRGLLPPPHPEIIVWSRDRVAPGGKTNTDAELQNIFELAALRGFTGIGVVTVFVHLLRTVTIARMHLANPKWRHLRAQFFASEDVLYGHDAKKWGPRLQELNGSESLLRTMFFECRGLNVLCAGD